MMLAVIELVLALVVALLEIVGLELVALLPELLELLLDHHLHLS